MKVVGTACKSASRFRMAEAVPRGASHGAPDVDPALRIRPWGLGPHYLSSETSA